MDVDFLFRAVQVANIKYIDKILGNYRQIEGTKTVNDLQSGQNKIRLECLYKKYRKDLPLLKRGYTYFLYTFYKVWFKIKYFIESPKRIIPSLKNKTTKSLKLVFYIKPKNIALSFKTRK